MMALFTSFFIAFALMALAIYITIRLTLFHRVRKRSDGSRSHIKVVDEHDYRALYFLHSDGSKSLESAMDHKDPVRLMLPYSEVMYVIHLLAPSIRRVLLVGLGGGSILKYYRRKMPWIDITVIELDHNVLQVARQHFQVSHSEARCVKIGDAFSYLSSNRQPFDGILVDAYITFSATTDSMGVPLHLKSQQWYELLRENISHGGIIAFNINTSKETIQDLEDMRKVFPEVRSCAVPRRRQICALCSTDTIAIRKNEIRKLAYELDSRIGDGTHFRELVDLV